jgi:CRISPR-associated protein Cas1
MTEAAPTVRTNGYGKVGCPAGGDLLPNGFNPVNTLGGLEYLWWRRRMGRLFERIWYLGTLREAWQRIQQKGSRGGIDGVGIEEFAQNTDRHLEDLSRAIREGRYSPEPTERIYAPKFNAAGEFRPLSLPTLKDKIVQQATRRAIEPLYERRFLNCSYAYRPYRGPMKAIAKVSHYVTEEKRRWAVLGDLDNFFDTLSHQRLLTEVGKVIYEPEILSLIRMWIKIGVVDPRGEYQDSTVGIAQGSIISPLLSNIYAHALDQHMVGLHAAYIRYADNLVVLCSTREEARGTLKVLESYIQTELQLKLNPENRPVRSLEDGFTFLGITFKGDGRFLAGEKADKIIRKIDWQTNWNRRQELPQIVSELNETVVGAVRYYGFLKPIDDFLRFDERLLWRLRGLFRSRVRSGEIVKKADLAGLVKSLPFFSAQEGPEAQRLRAELVRESFSNVELVEPDPGGEHNRSADRIHPDEAGTQPIHDQEGRSTHPRLREARPAQETAPDMTPGGWTAREESGQDPQGISTEACAVAPSESSTPENVVRGSSDASPAFSPASSRESANEDNSLDESADRKIESKKRHYVRRSVVESDLVVQTHGVFIGHRSNRVVLRKDRKTIHSQPLMKVKSISIHSRGVSLSSDLIEACARLEIPIVFSSFSGQCYACLQTPAATKPDLGLLQLRSLQDGTALNWAREFVLGKTRNQLNLLKFYLRHRREQDGAYATKVDEAEKSFDEIQARVKAIEACIPIEGQRDQLFAQEGRAGAIYWDAIKLLLPKDTPFPGRVTQGATDLVNSLLNFGYGILYPRIERALLAAGLNLQTSMLHAPQEGKWTLAFDFIEPFRAPVVDRAVFSLITKGRELDQTAEGRLTEDSIRLVVEAVSKRLGTLVPYGGEKITLEQVIHKQARLLARSLRNEKRFKAFVSRY